MTKTSLDENLFGFIFKTAKKRGSRIKSEGKLKKKIRSMSSSFEDAVSDMITDLVLDNIDYLANIIIENNPHELAVKDANILRMLLSNQKAKNVLNGAKKQRRFIKWDTGRILESVVIILDEKGIKFNRDELRWLAKNIHEVGVYVYS